MDLSGYTWLNESSHEWLPDGGIRIDAPARTDFFTSPVPGEAPPGGTANAPFLHTVVTGDFVLRARVSHAFADMYDACALLVRHDASVWAKTCFEGTDLGTRAVVSVVTRGTSDDANGPNVRAGEVWLQVSRVGPVLAFHYSLDGERFDMTRLFALPMPSSVQVGLVAQAPVGSGGARFFRDVSLEHRTVANLRAGA